MESPKPKDKKPRIGEPCNGCGFCCLMQVCSTGSWTLGLVSEFGQRAPGPCPALIDAGGVFSCGLVARPKDYSTGSGSAHDLRRAVKILIGAGAGCDEAGDEPDADEALRWIGDEYVERVGVEAINRAAAVWHGL